MRKFYAMLVTLFIALIAQAQTSTTKVSGTVNDAEDKALAGVTVSLLRVKDSSLAKLAVTDKVGQYELQNIKAGSYIISFTSVGFTKAFSKKIDVGEAPVELPVTTLIRAEAQDIAGVTVTARRPLVETKIDKMVVNVDASPTNAGNTALDVLEKSPGISIDRDGNISLKGKAGVIILIDNKPTYLSGQDLTNFLRNLPANQLDQIELMTQPSAKYDASGNSGVINFRTKKNIAKGFNGSVNLSYVQGRYPKSPNSINFNYRQGKVNLFSNLSYSYFEGFNDMSLNRLFKNKATGQDTFSIFQNTNMRFKGTNYSARVGLDYSINKKTSIGFNVNGTYSLRQMRSETVSDFFDANKQLQSINEARSNSKEPWKNFGANINFRKSLKAAGEEFSADLDYIKYNSRSNQTSDNFRYNPSKIAMGTPYLLRGLLPQDISIYNGKLDYVRPITKESKIEMGAKSSYVKIDNNAPYFSYDNVAKRDTVDARSDHFIYDENVNAAYVNYSHQLKKWGLQLGLRLEHTHSIANSINVGSKIKKDYAQLFPTTYISYKLNDKNNFGLSYGRRLERPNYQDMNPFQRLLDQFTFQQGNPYLTPQFTHNIEASHNYKGQLNTVVNYTYTTDIINEIIRQNNETKVSFQTKENIATRRNIGLAVSYNAPVTKWWSTSVYGNVFNNYFEGIVNNAPLQVSITSFMANMSQQFRFAKTWNAEVNGFFRSKSQEGGLMLAEPMGVVSFGVGKQIIGGKGTVKLSISDPFRFQQFRGNIRFDNINMSLSALNDVRRVGLSFSYRFSKGQNVQQRKKASSSQDEQNRVGGGQN